MARGSLFHNSTEQPVRTASQQASQQRLAPRHVPDNHHPAAHPLSTGCLSDLLRRSVQVCQSTQYYYRPQQPHSPPSLLRSNFLLAHPDKLIVVKFYATYCQACKALEPKFLQVKRDQQLIDLPIVWAEFSANRDNKLLFQNLEVLTLPTIHFHDGSRGIVENFSCPPSKIPLLKKKLSRFLNARVDPNTRQLKYRSVADETKKATPDEPRVERPVTLDSKLIKAEHLNFLRYQLPFFRDLNNQEFAHMMSHAKLYTFNPGDIIIRQGMPGEIFYVVKSGVVEMSIRSRFEDPISTPTNYLGAIVSELTQFDYFGERALTTGEPYAASVRARDKTRCFAFHVDDMPASSIFSKQRRATAELVEQLSERYALPEDYDAPYNNTKTTVAEQHNILELLVRFKQIRQAAKCFDYIMKTEPKWGDVGEIARRSLLVSKLSRSQRDDFEAVFDLVQSHNTLTVLELRKFMESARQQRTDSELLEMIRRSNPMYDEAYGIGRDEFLGVMAEAEFYSLFTETFEALDQEKRGYVRAGDLDDILGGVRDLISNDRKSIIDGDDKDLLVDYEQFSKMLLGAAL